MQARRLERLQEKFLAEGDDVQRFIQVVDEGIGRLPGRQGVGAMGRLLAQSDATQLPLEGRSVAEFAAWLTPVLFDPQWDAKTVNLDAGIDNVTGSASNFYAGVTAAEVEAFYAAKSKEPGNARLSLGLNSQLTKVDGRLVERPWKVGGMYGAAIEKIVSWLELAVTVAENDGQRESLRHLIRFYRTGDLAAFDEHCIAWVRDTESAIDVVNGSGVSGQAQAVMDALVASGFTAGEVSSDSTPVDATEIHHAPGAERAADLVARHLTGGAVLVVDDDLDPLQITLVTGPDFTTVQQAARPPVATDTAGGATSTTSSSTTSTTIGHSAGDPAAEGIDCD